MFDAWITRVIAAILVIELAVLSPLAWRKFAYDMRVSCDALTILRGSLD